MADIFYTVGNDMHRVARVERGEIVELDFEYIDKPISNLNGVYLGKVIEIQKPLNAAFVDLGLSKPGIIPLKEGNLEILKQGDRALVQVIRTENPLENKGPRLSRLITLSLGPLLYTPFRPGLNFSKRIKNTQSIETLITLTPNEGVVVRSWASPEEPYESMIETLRKEWNEIQSYENEKTPKQVGPSYGLLSRTIRSMGINDSLITDCRQISNRFADRATYISEAAFDDRCETAWESLLTSFVPLPDGGNIYIEETQALVVIDVNSQGSLRHALPFNRKVVKEILKQIRLRDLGGKIIVDLIHPPKSWKQLFVDAEIRSDIQVWGISSLGLLEMIRQKKRLSLPQRLKLEIN